MRLPHTLDLARAEPLRAELLARRGSPLELEAGDVQRLGGPCLQVLLAAQAMWRGDGQSFQVAGPSEAFLNAVRLMGAGRLVWSGSCS